MASAERSIKIKFTGDTRDLDRATRKAQRDIEKMSKGILKATSDTAAEIPGLFSTISEAIPPQGKAVAIAILVGLAPALASIAATALTSAILLAVGGGALALGIKAAIDNPNVAKAFDGLRTKASKLLEDFGKPFEQPLIRAAKTFSKVLDDIKPQVQAVGKLVAPLVDTLAPALASFLKNMIPGIVEAVKASVPLWNTLAAKLPQIGTAIGKFFSLISQNGDDTNQFVSDLIDFIGGLIISLGWVISKLASMYSSFRSFFGNVRVLMLQFTVAITDMFGRVLEAAVRAFGWIPGLGPKLKAAQKGFYDFRNFANAELNRIHDKNINVRIFTDVKTKVSQVNNTLDRLAGRRASGGPVAAGRSYLVGERGPEVVTFGQSGYVTPNNQLGSSGPEIIQLTLDLGRGIQQVIDINLKQHDRQMARTLKAA